ncbi:MAG: DUF421 domain-containing protein [Clostridia bacterium]|nr:DUF421 domain-containing protein [Clostridia bacterium]
MIVTFIRTLIIYIILVVVMRLMGKRQIGEMQPFEFIVTLIIADLACIPMADLSIPLIYGVGAVLTLFLLHQLFTLIEQSGNFAKRVLSGTPSLVINKNGVDFYELKKNNLGLEDLIESMRAQGYFSLDDLDYAVFESNGKLSAFENTARKETETPSSFPLLIVNKGKILNKNSAILNDDAAIIKKFLAEHGASLKNTEVLTVDGNGRAYFKKKNEKFKILNYPLKKEITW